MREETTMSATMIDGKATSEQIRREIAEEVARLTAQGCRKPGLAVVLVGEDPASVVYTSGKQKVSQEAGFHSVKRDLPADTPQEKLLEVIRELNADPAIDGILCQLPLPPQCNENQAILAIDPDKDVDGLHPINTGRLAAGLPGFVPCTPLGCKELLRRYNVKTDGANLVMLGRSNLVGTPMALLMMQKAEGANATVTVCHSRTRDLPGVCRTADILVAAIGRARMVKADWVKEGAVVIDVGINRVEDASKKSGYRLVGDVDYDAVLSKVSAITPVPGGVGPMTIAMLLSNTLLSYKRRMGLG
jgi:methylenetetrahydrofolate dehydrogenase (NADP+)/methenyltetrahydrofolate cyclohydrolase